MIHGRDKSRELHIKVHVFAETLHEYVVLEVEDDGKGIEPIHLKKVGKEVLRSKHKGGGSGLYNLSQTLLLSFGKKARLEINSQYGKKTSIRLIIPFMRTQ